LKLETQNFNLTTSLIRPLTNTKHSRVLVVGGGIAGIQASLDLAAMGLPVTLVEARPSLGGVMAQLDKTFPTNDCAMCILSPRLLEISRNPAVDLVTSSRLVHLAGEPGNFRAILHRAPRYVDTIKCTGCGECTRVCPAKIPDPYNVGLKQTKAIHLPFPQAVPLSAYVHPEACRFLQGKKCEACVKVCQANAINLHDQPEEWTLEIGAVVVAAGAEPARPENFMSVQCQNVVTSIEFERILSATGPYMGKLRRPSDEKPPSRIAFIQCVGSRDPRLGTRYCSSVCCTASLKEAVIATELSDGGLDTAIFYMDLRTPGKNFERYVEQAQMHGVRLVRSRVTNIYPDPQGNVNIRFTDAQGTPREETFDLAVLAVGLTPPAVWSTLAADWGLALNSHGFLASSPLNRIQTSRPGIFICGTAREPMDITETVILAGAAAAAASQLLATIPRNISQLPQLPETTLGEGSVPRIGVFLCHCGTNIAGVLNLEALAPVLRQLPGVVHVEETLFACSLESTKQIAAVIQSKNLNRLVVAACTPRTHEPVFREVVSTAGLNPGYVIMANVREQCAWVHQTDKDAAMAKARHLIAMAVAQAGRLSPLQPQSFAIIPSALILGGGVAGLSAALSLADQGFQCYLVERQQCLGGLAQNLHFTLEGPNPQQFLSDLKSQVFIHPNIAVFTRSRLVRLEGHCGQFKATVRQQTSTGPQQLQLEHGVIIVATGGKEFKPHKRFLYGEDNRVLTQLELENRIPAGTLSVAPTSRIVMIQCVGSREPEHPYCSRLCCSAAIKNAIILKDRWPLTEVTILYRDIRSYGFQEDYYLLAKDKGVRFLPYAVARPPRLKAPRHGPLLVTIWDELLSREIQLPANYLVLSAGIEPQSDSAKLSQLLGVQRSAEGFFLEAHQKLRPVEAATEGIFLCGLAHSPRNLPETISQAQAAAAAAARVLYQKTILSSDYTAQLHGENCRRCLSCLEICPVGAISLGEDGKPVIHLEICRGCGTCAAQCPARAIAMNRLTESELTAQIEGLFST
jgi:heterodisulfide reductase subunit A